MGCSGLLGKFSTDQGVRREERHTIGGSAATPLVREGAVASCGYFSSQLAFFFWEEGLLLVVEKTGKSTHWILIRGRVCFCMETERGAGAPIPHPCMHSANENR